SGEASAFIALTPDSVSKTRDATPDRLRRRLRGDLDNIVLTALRKDLQHRYASVQQFSEDIRRHLKGLPVIARADTLGYRATKFIRRNRISVAAAAMVLITLVGGLSPSISNAGALSVALMTCGSWRIRSCLIITTRSPICRAR